VWTQIREPIAMFYGNKSRETGLIMDIVSGVASATGKGNT